MTSLTFHNPFPRILCTGLGFALGTWASALSLEPRVFDPSGLASPWLQGWRVDQGVAWAATSDPQGEPAGEGAALGLMEQGNQRYQQGQYAEAAQIWQRALEQQGDRPSLQTALTLTHLALAYSQLSQWQPAQGAIDRSQAQLQSLRGDGTPGRQHLFVQAKIHNAQGTLWLLQGHLQGALDAFTAASQIYGQLGDRSGQQQNQLNQAKVLQLQGRNTLAQEQLTALATALTAEPPSTLKAATLRELAKVEQATTSNNNSAQRLQESLEAARAVGDRSEEIATLLQLGTLFQGIGDWEQAIGFYDQILALNPTPTLAAQVQVNRFRVQVNQTPVDFEGLARDRVQVDAALAAAPVNRTTLYAAINYSQSLLDLATLEGQPRTQDLTPIIQRLGQTIQSAQALGDAATASYGLGQLGRVYEVARQWPEAQRLTQEALDLAENLNVGEIAYQWQWQLGRVLMAQEEYGKAEAAYEGSIGTLDSLRADLASLNPDTRFSFREEIEPVYREYVRLLLTPRASAPGEKPSISQGNLQKARDAIESLQVAELVNFFQADCVVVKPVNIDQVDPKSGVIYTIMLGDRLEILLSQPNQPIYHQSVVIDEQRIDSLVAQVRQKLESPAAPPRRESQALYNFLIKPLEGELEARDLETLVFVSDGSLRNLPLALLYDGERYLVEKYAIALTPGLKLFDPQPLASRELRVIVAALSEARQDFSALPAVEGEIEQIGIHIPSQVLFNQDFQEQLVASTIQSDPAPLVHFATHGQFGSRAEDTFILTWDGKIDINEFSSLLQGGFLKEDEAIELLVFSACETAAGDDRAALGLAGLAVRSGARSTVATLWQVDDTGTSTFMDYFYDQLSQNVPKAQALRQAQLQMIQSDEGFSHPYYWAPFVLVGNWL